MYTKLVIKYYILLLGLLFQLLNISYLFVSEHSLTGAYCSTHQNRISPFYKFYPPPSPPKRKKKSKKQIHLTPVDAFLHPLQNQISHLSIYLSDQSVLAQARPKFC